MSAMSDMHVEITEAAHAAARDDSERGIPGDFLPIDNVKAMTDARGIDWDSDFADDCVDVYTLAYNAARRTLDPHCYS